MLTFLTIEKKDTKRLLPLRDKISVELKSAGSIDVQHIKYIHRRGKVRFDKIAKICGSEGRRLLTKEDLVFPKESNLKRFCCEELKSRLCLNMAIEVLKNIKSKSLKVAVYDVDGKIADGVGDMLKFIKNLTVVTRATDIYTAEAERLVSESGAVLNVSKRLKSLENAHLILVPQKLSAQLPVSKSAVILTTSAPKVSERCAVYYKYYFSLSEELIKLLPEGFDAEYLASALYTLCSRFDLGSIVPQAVKGEGAAHTIVSLSKYLLNIASNT